MLVLLAGASAAALWAFLWPDEDSWINVGVVEDFPRGSVTTFGREDNPRAFHIVGLEDGELLALWARSTHRGYHVPYQPDFVYNDREGWFVSRYHAIYDLAGYRLFGPAPRGLDRFALEIRDGNVYVDPQSVTRGARSAPPGYEFQAGGVVIARSWLHQP